MVDEIEFVDAAIGQMVDAIEGKAGFDSTAIIITAKHGQSPIDTDRFFPIPGDSGTNGRRRLGSLRPFSRCPRPPASDSPRMISPSYG